ncbi:hypothetical protein GJ496_008148 [Pomphorhynchus laevis]|nr:hypothetical protein GJ496_008148 [Pomphorhynchus laevis]
MYRRYKAKRQLKDDAEKFGKNSAQFNARQLQRPLQPLGSTIPNVNFLAQPNLPPPQLSTVAATTFGNSLLSNPNSPKLLNTGYQNLQPFSYGSSSLPMTTSSYPYDVASLPIPSGTQKLPVLPQRYKVPQRKPQFPTESELNASNNNDVQSYYIEQSMPADESYDISDKPTGLQSTGFKQQILSPPVRVWPVKRVDNSPFKVFIDIKLRVNDSTIISEQAISCGRSFFNKTQNYQLVTEDNIIMKWDKHIGDYLIRNGSMLRLRKRNHPGRHRSKSEKENLKMKVKKTTEDSLSSSSDSFSSETTQKSGTNRNQIDGNMMY